MVPAHKECLYTLPTVEDSETLAIDPDVIPTSKHFRHLLPIAAVPVVNIPGHQLAYFLGVPKLGNLLLHRKLHVSAPFTANPKKRVGYLCYSREGSRDQPISIAATSVRKRASLATAKRTPMKSVSRPPRRVPKLARPPAMVTKPCMRDR